MDALALQNALLKVAQARTEDWLATIEGFAPTRDATETDARHWSGPFQFNPTPAPERLPLFAPALHGC